MFSRGSLVLARGKSTLISIEEVVLIHHHLRLLMETSSRACAMRKRHHIGLDLIIGLRYRTHTLLLLLNSWLELLLTHL